MESTQQRAVTACMTELVQGMGVRDVVLRLRSGHNPVLSHKDAATIKKQMLTAADEDSAESLLELLMKSKDAFPALVSALRDTKQQHLAEILLSHEAAIIQLDLVNSALGGLVDELRPALLDEAKGETTTTTTLLDQSATTLAANLLESFDVRDENDALRMTVDNLTTTSARLTEERDELQTKLTRVADQKTNLEERVRGLETQLLGKETELLHLHDEDRLVRERTELTTALDQTKTELDQTKGALVESRSREQKDGLNIAYQRSLLDSIAIALIIGGDGRKTTIEAVSLFGGPLRTGVLHVSVTHSSATRLPDGRVLHTGGWAEAGAPATAAFIDAATLTFSTAPELPRAVADHATATLGDTTFSVGGWDGEKITSDCAAFRNGAWELVKAMREPRSNHALASDGFQLAVVGGRDGNQRLSTVELYSPGANVWTSGPNIGTAKSSLRAAYLDGRFFVVGGWDGSYMNYYPTVEAWDPRTPAWESMAPIRSPRWGHGLLALGGKLIAFGGCIRINGKYEDLDTVEVYDPAADRWSPTEARLSKPGSFFAYCAL